MRFTIPIINGKIVVFFNRDQIILVIAPHNNNLATLLSKNQIEVVGDRKFEAALDEIARLKVANSNKLLAQKKLHLVLDLDHTLLHTKSIKKLTPDELYLKEQANGSLFVLDDCYLMKLRPFIWTLLKKQAPCLRFTFVPWGATM
ncbi:hypothetical protein Dsin_005117 [Dipteronia sinensis]|uniref:protein-serine/threonine phosphatase n=1 Tax=Dipteronia sinensis TaxID=43782 RepID=A0AAE0AWW0_9ROSI|nr:hypothetical protein Dsin_005117 [Dipteronia sinensis]